MTNITNQTRTKLDELRAQTEQELAVAEEELTKLRQQRDNIAAVVKQKVHERDELKRAVSALTPRTRRTTRQTDENSADESE